MVTIKLYQQPWLHICTKHVTMRYNSKVTTVTIRRKSRVINQATLLGV